jgi:hypothetical protein
MPLTMPAAVISLKKDVQLRSMEIRSPVPIPAAGQNFL